MLVWCLMVAQAVALAAALPGERGCELVPTHSTFIKRPGDNNYRLMINGNVERYVPDKRYFVSLVGIRTHGQVQKFTRFKIVALPASPSKFDPHIRQGEFQLFPDNLTSFERYCTNTVVESNARPKTEVQVMWIAPSHGSGCINLSAMVFENETSWFASEGGLTMRLCEEKQPVVECCACDDAKYKMVFEGLWSSKTHPKDFPVEAAWLTHFSDVIGATHPKNYSFWGEGLIATDGFRSLAEWGSVGLLELELRQQGRNLRSIVKAQGLWHPKVNTNTSAVFTVDRSRSFLSLASMFGPSPDWVVGVNGLDLCNKNCTWAESKTVDLYPYDAGTDDGISYLSPNAETIPREKIYRITTMYPEDPRAPFYNPLSKKMEPLARLYLVREKIIPRSCTENDLLSFQLDDTENLQSVNRLECAVSKWGAWTPCSVSCGKGLRMRNRAYLVPEKSAMFDCDRQLVSKEMCVAEKPECPERSPEREPEEEGVAPLEEVGGLCKTDDWGPWSECSVTCGIGVSTRRRAFVNHMGHKKCPLVSVEENRKCMQPQCMEKEHDVSDPACPTTAWTGWSPCSASCGHGVRFRTRLLLVPPERQQECSGKVELLQQRPCHERDNCTMDMLTAKRVCMEKSDQGPCRGVYQRWTFAVSKGMCVPFIYGGCRGNQNNFLTQEECMNTCKIILGAVGAPSANTNSTTLDSTTQRPSLIGHETRTPCRMTAWSGWSDCTVQCGVGTQDRTRKVLEQPRGTNTTCPTLLRQRRRCLRYC